MKHLLCESPHTLCRYTYIIKRIQVVQLNCESQCYHSIWYSANAVCMLYMCYIKLKNCLLLSHALTMSKHSVSRQDSCAIGLTCCGIMIEILNLDKLVLHVRTYERNVLVDLICNNHINYSVTGLKMVTCSYLKVNILINLIDIVTDVIHLRMASHTEIPAHYIVTIPTSNTGKCSNNTLCISKEEISEIIGVQSQQLIVTNCTFTR